MAKRKPAPSTPSPATTASPGSHPAPQPAIVGPVTELRRVGRHAATTADELRAFLRQLEGRSPKEMLGTVASSSLVQSLIVSTIGTVVLVAAFTIVPFAWDLATKKEPASAPGSVAAAEDEQAATSPAPDRASPSDGGESPSRSDSSPVPPEAIDKLGLGEERSAPPTVNPLDEADDDLLKGLD